MRVLVTGATGFVGSHLLDHLLGSGQDVLVHALVRTPGSADAMTDGVTVLAGDLLDPASLRAAVKASRPDVVFHLAARSSVAASLDSPVKLVEVNVMGTLQLLEAVRATAPESVVVLAGSADSYGCVAAADLPITEEQPLLPLSPYAVSKATVDLLGCQYFHAYGLRTVRLRLFNHCGPRQSERFVVAALARQIAEIETGLAPPELKVGDVSVRRDFVDVRDVARAYWLAATRGEPGGAYNVASGKARSIGEVAEMLLATSGVEATLVVDAERVRAAEIPELRGDASLLGRVTGWAPAISFDRTVRDTLAYWRERVTTCQ